MFAIPMLLAAAFPLFECSWKDFDPSIILPWAKKVPIKDYKLFIELRLVKKDWMPPTPTLPSKDKVVDNYPGLVDEVYGLFRKGVNEFTYTYTERLMTEGLELMTQPESGYNPDLPSVFIVHTISEDANKFFVRNTVTALALRNIVKHYNVFTLNMPDLQVTMEQAVWFSLFGDKDTLRGFGEAIGSFLEEGIQKALITLDKINIISFCFSSQLAGFVGRHLSSRNEGRKIKSIIGMDPYSVLFSSIDHQVLSSKDAQIVHIYHTNSLFFGTFKRHGTADFVVNNGNLQPGCFERTPWASMDCSHQRAVMILWYSILYPDKFVARRCRFYLLFVMCACKKNPTSKMSFPLNVEARGIYFLKTTATKPYAIGPSGGETCKEHHPKDLEDMTES